MQQIILKVMLPNTDYSNCYKDIKDMSVSLVIKNGMLIWKYAYMKLCSISFMAQLKGSSNP